MSKVNPRCFFDMEIGGEKAGRLVFELFADEVPKTAENFRALCTGERGRSASSGATLHYKGSHIHRIVADFMLQGGDFTAGDGKGGESIYGAAFTDESFERKHDRDFLLSMANRGPDTNGSQFFITCVPTPHLDGKHVVFGRVVSGQDIARRIETLPVDKKSRPHDKVTISNCGELERVVTKRAPVAARARSPSVSSSNSSSSDVPMEDKKRRRASLSNGSGSDSDRGTSSSSEGEDRKRKRKKDKKRKRKEKKQAKKARKLERDGETEPKESQHPSSNMEVASEPEEKYVGIAPPEEVESGRVNPLSRDAGPRGRAYRAPTPLRLQENRTDVAGRAVKGRGVVRFGSTEPKQSRYESRTRYHREPASRLERDDHDRRPDHRGQHRRSSHDDRKEEDLRVGLRRARGEQIHTEKDARHSDFSLPKEMADLAKTPISGANAHPASDDDFLHWTGDLTAPAESAFKGGVFKILVEFPTDYPFKPPKVKFDTKIYHPNVDDDGAICIGLLKTEVWKPSTKLPDVLVALLDLLQNPVPEDALRPAIAQVYTTDQAKFQKTAKEWVKKYCT